MIVLSSREPGGFRSVRETLRALLVYIPTRLNGNFSRKNKPSAPLLRPRFSPTCISATQHNKCVDSNGGVKSKGLCDKFCRFLGSMIGFQTSKDLV